VLVIGLLLAFSIPRAIAEAPISPIIPTVEVLDSTTTIIAYIKQKALEAKIEPSEIIRTLTCESHLDPQAIGDKGTSYGLSQIHLPAHPEITKDQALDPRFAVDFAVDAFSHGEASMWTCYRLLYQSGN
jgi:hypothetical protein